MKVLNTPWQGASSAILGPYTFVSWSTTLSSAPPRANIRWYIMPLYLWMPLMSTGRTGWFSSTGR